LGKRNTREGGSREKGEKAGGRVLALKEEGRLFNLHMPKRFRDRE
jgi:hypothetical protein